MRPKLWKSHIVYCPTKHNVLHHNVGMSQSLLCMTELHNFDFIIDIFAEQQLTFVISVISVFLLDCKTHSGVSCSRTFNIATGQQRRGKMMRVCFLIGLKKKELQCAQCATIGHFVNKKCYIPNRYLKLNILNSEYRYRQDWGMEMYLKSLAMNELKILKPGARHRHLFDPK